MTNPIISSSVVKEEKESDKTFPESILSTPTKSNPKCVKNSPRNKQSDFRQEGDKSKVRFGHGSSISPRGSPNGKSRGTPSKSPRQSPSNSDLYAGFSDSPAPAALPKPPSHWMSSIQIVRAPRSCHREAARFESRWNLMLNAQA